MALSMFLIVIIALIVLIAFIFIYYFNKFATLSNRIDNSLSQIDVQLRKRGDLVPNLMETVKGYAKHEKKIITEVTNARKALVSAGTLPERMKAGSQFTICFKIYF